MAFPNKALLRRTIDRVMARHPSYHVSDDKKSITCTGCDWGREYHYRQGAGGLSLSHRAHVARELAEALHTDRKPPYAPSKMYWLDIRDTDGNLATVSRKLYTQIGDANKAADTHRDNGYTVTISQGHLNDWRTLLDDRKL